MTARAQATRLTRAQSDARIQAAVHTAALHEGASERCARHAVAYCRTLLATGQPLATALRRAAQYAAALSGRCRLSWPVDLRADP